MAGNKVIAIDLGGTYLRVGVVKNNKIIKYEKKKTPENKKALLNELFGSISHCIDKNVKGIGIASPGPLKDGVIKNPPNLTLKNFNLKKVLEKKFHKRTEIENDANCVALAELKFGCKKNNFIVLTLGTGIGGGIIINGEPYRGQGYAGELGHIVLDNGKYFEDCAGWKRMKKLIEKDFRKDIWLTDLIKMKDKKAKKVIKELSYYLGQGIASLINIFDPEIVVLGGGMREAGNSFLNIIKKETEKYIILPHKPKIVWSKLNHPGILGASLLIK